MTNVAGIEKGTYYIIKIISDFKINNLPHAKEVAEMALALGHKFFGFDLSHCSSLSSSAIGLIANLNKKCAALGGKVAIINPTQRVRIVLSSSKIGLLVEVVETEEQVEMAFR